MRNFTKLVMVLLVIAAMLLSGCAGLQTNQQKGTASGAGIGAGVGAILGQFIGGDTEATLIGAGVGSLIGGIAGNQIGKYMDKQQAALRQLAAQNVAMQVAREGNSLRATFGRTAFFMHDSAQLLSGALVDIHRVAQVLNQYPQTTIMVEGHTDRSGSEEYNQRLSERRAQSVANALIAAGVAPQRIRTRGYGESRPISSDPATNRRTEILIAPVQA